VRLPRLRDSGDSVILTTKDTKTAKRLRELPHFGLLRVLGVLGVLGGSKKDCPLRGLRGAARFVWFVDKSCR
jgi:hypothetical protein